MQEDLLEELRLMVHPVVVGSGRRLFEEGGDSKNLELVDSKTFSTGVLYLTIPAGAQLESLEGREPTPGPLFTQLS